MKAGYGSVIGYNQVINGCIYNVTRAALDIFIPIGICIASNDYSRLEYLGTFHATWFIFSSFAALRPEIHYSLPGPHLLYTLLFMCISGS